MSRIDSVFAIPPSPSPYEGEGARPGVTRRVRGDQGGGVAKKSHKALIGYVTVGYPDIKTTLEVVPSLAAAGCDMMELGIPFSDPLADGATIQEASCRALRQGVTPRSCLEVAAQLRREVDIPLVLMTYYNSVFGYGLEAFCQAAVEGGVDGLIVPDLPPEEGMELETLTRQHQMDLIYLLAPTSTEGRIGLIAERSTGFIYLVSLTGITGARKELPPDLEDFVARVRQMTEQPLCVGFGVSTPTQASQVARIADGVIVGSRLIQLLGEPPFTRLIDFVRRLRHALDAVPQGE